MGPRNEENNSEGFSVAPWSVLYFFGHFLIYFFIFFVAGGMELQT